MHLLQELRKEHDLIDPVIGSMRSFVGRLAAGFADPADADRFLVFFRLFAGKFHHAREEDVLFRALVEEADLPRDRGPLANLSADHRALEGMLEKMAPLFRRAADSAEDANALSQLTTRYCRTLWLHIDVENSVLFHEAEERLRRANIFELPCRIATQEEERARRMGEALVSAYPPADDPDLIRGEQCVICPHFGGSCNGIEREWWGEAEWNEFSDHVG